MADHKRKMTDAIGGYFGLELRQGEHYHRDAIRLNTGRNCFEYILRARGYKHVWLPYYMCEVLLEPLHKLHIPHSFYSINEQLEPTTLPSLQAEEAFLYTNYYGLKQTCVERLAAHYGKQLIIDNAQAFYAIPLSGIDTFYTARKFFGVPDGAYLYTDAYLDIDIPQDESLGRMSHLLKRIEQGAENGFADYHQHEENLCNQQIKRMSRITERLLENIDYKAVAKQRRENYQKIEQALQASNRLILSMSEDAVPMVYPYWIPNGAEFRQSLQQQRIYTATYWPNVIQLNSPTLEQNLSTNLLPLPIDQRYNKKEIEYIKNQLI